MDTIRLQKSLVPSKRAVMCTGRSVLFWSMLAGMPIILRYLGGVAELRG